MNFEGVSAMGTGEVTGEPQEEEIFAWATRIHIGDIVGEWTFTKGSRKPRYYVPDSVSYTVEQVPLVPAIGEYWFGVDTTV